MQVGLGFGHIALDEDPAPPPQRGTDPQFSVHVCCGQMAGWIKMSLGMKVGLGLGDFVLHGYLAPNFRPMSIVAKWLDASGYHLVRR